jgi:hypothetical protein
MHDRLAFRAGFWGRAAVVRYGVENRAGPVVDQRLDPGEAWAQAHGFATLLSEEYELLSGQERKTEARLQLGLATTFCGFIPSKSDSLETRLSCDNAVVVVQKVVGSQLPAGDSQVSRNCSASRIARTIQGRCDRRRPDFGASPRYAGLGGRMNRPS